MGILVDRDARVLIQGITGKVARSITERLQAAGTPIVAGVVPGRSGLRCAGVEVYPSCHDAVAATGADCSVIIVPVRAALEAALEALDAGIRMIVLYVEAVPVLDAVRIAAYARARGAAVIGPNSVGLIDPAAISLSEMDKRLLLAGSVGVVAKSGAMCAESAEALRRAGLGCSTILSIGGDPVVPLSHGDVLWRFEADPATRGVVMVGEIGGRSEHEAAAVIRTMTKPVVALVLGRAAPPGKQMGHAGAVTGEPDENWEAKTAALSDAGAIIAGNVFEVGALMRRALGAG